MQRTLHHGLLHQTPIVESKTDDLSDDFVILEKSDYDFPEEIKPQPPTTNYLQTTARYSLSFLSLMVGCAIETLQFYTGLKDIPGKLLGFIPLSPPIRASLAAIYFLQAFVINKKFTNQVIDNIIHIIQGDHIPEWPELTSANTYKANFISLFINAYAGFSDALATSYYMKQQGYGLDQTTNFLIGVISSLTNLTEPYETHLFIRSHFSNSPRQDQPLSTQQRITETPINLIKLCGALQDTVESYTSSAAIAATLLGITSPSLRIPALILSMANGLTDIMFNGKMSSEAFHSLTTAIANREYNLKEMTTLLISFFTASIIGHAQLSVILSMLKDPEATLPPPLPGTMPDELAIAVSIGTGIRELVNYTYYFYPIYKSVFDAIETIILNMTKLTHKETLKSEQLGRGTLFYHSPTLSSHITSPPQESTPSTSLNKKWR